MRSRALTIGFVLILCESILGTLLFPAQAQVNSYTNNTDGKWETPGNWSLNLAPTNPQSVFITNAVTKTVTIDSTTSSNFPQTMTVNSLTLSGAGVVNTLLLSNAGPTPPLQVLNAVTIANGGALLISNSELVVDNVGGASGGFDGLVVGNSGQGALTVNGGTLMLDGGINLGGNSGSAGTLTLNGGEIMLNGGINVGAPGALGTAWVTGGQVICTNLFALLFIGGGQNVGLMVVSNGLVSASQIYVESSGTLSIQGGEVSDVGGASSPIDTFYGGTIIFNSGRLETASLVGSQLFVIGDGTHAATMQLLGGGTLDFSFSGDGIIVASNSFLTGCGYIKASPVLNFGTITNDCAGGTLTFAYDVTNTGLVVAASGAIIDFNGPTINNGVIDARAGNVNFKSAFTNNGTVLGISLTEIYAPVADFTASPPSGPSPLTATFTDASWGVITNQLYHLK